MLGRENRNNAASVGLGAQIDRHVAQIRLLTAADCTIGHENESTERGNPSHQLIAIDPRIDALLERQIHPWRAHFNVEEKSFGVS
jgi:hypothetical protein